MQTLFTTPVLASSNELSHSRTPKQYGRVDDSSNDPFVLLFF